jgi:hypothetical protein
MRPKKFNFVGIVKEHRFSEFAILVFLKARKFCSVKKSKSSRSLFAFGGFIGQVGTKIAS